MSILYRILSLLFKYEEIDGHGRRLYLVRWVLWRSKRDDGTALYLHHFLGSDWSQDLHDHPKPFVSVGLWGGYIERHLDESKHITSTTYKAPFVRAFSASHAHRLMLADPKRTTWTLVLVGAREREWGFFTRKGWSPWHEYVHSYEAVQGFEADRTK